MHGATYGTIHFIKPKLIKYIFNFFFRANARKIYVRMQAKITQQLKSSLTENVRLQVKFT